MTGLMTVRAAAVTLSWLVRLDAVSGYSVHVGTVVCSVYRSDLDCIRVCFLVSGAWPTVELRIYTAALSEAVNLVVIVVCGR